jgi:phosphoribosylaminoimidazolecarboxamide formyltransferase/IMP cyclohydrolase
LPIERALLSVYDKGGIVDFARGLVDLKVEILASGGTARALKEAGVQVKDVSSVTGFPEILGGRVKTLHPVIHAGILAKRDDPAQKEELKSNNILPIDMVVCNLYPFMEVVARGSGMDEAMANVDIGGPAMIRAAAKNHEFVLVVTDPNQYGDVLREMAGHGDVTSEMRKEFARRAFRITAAYDSAIHKFLQGAKKDIELPRTLWLVFEKVKDLRYGENPHQRGAFYREGGSFEIQGKELSFNNIMDLDAAMTIVSEFDTPACAIIKHSNPCGVALGGNPADAYRRAHLADPVSAFGGIIGLNRRVDAEAAEEMVSTFVECLIAPSYDGAALERFKKKKNLRVMELPSLESGRSQVGLDYKRVKGGLLVQDADDEEEDSGTWEVVTHRQPKEKELEAAKFGWKIVRHVRSNAVVLTTNDRTIGVGAGQMSRVDSTEMALKKARGVGAYTVGTAMASDGFIPFADSVEIAAKAGATVVIQPGGSIRDSEVIAACNENDIAMIFTKRRHFKH